MIEVGISLGEVVDRITILEIKKELIKDPAKLEDIGKELESLTHAYDAYCEETGVTVPELLWQKMYDLNLSLWNILDDQRKMEVAQQFDKDFIDVSRAVYFENDLRFTTKREIDDYDNDLFAVKEQKSYE